MYYRITKYNPEFRDEKGRYILDEWTSVSDIGKAFSGNILSEKEYLKIEGSYIKAICLFLEENNVSALNIESLEIYEGEEIIPLKPEEREFISKITDNMTVNITDAEIIAKLVLRELMWCKFCAEKNNFKIEFGYDYYMYVRCDSITPVTKDAIMNNGLYIEQIHEIKE